MLACLAWLSGAEAASLEEAIAAQARGDLPVAVPLLTSLAEDGNTEAMVRLGALYQKGEGVTRDATQAAALYTRAAAAGNAQAQFSLGNMYLLGEGVPQDDDWAFTYYRQAAAQGHALAGKNVSEFYRAAGIQPPAFPALPAGGAAALPATLPGARDSSAESTDDEEMAAPADSVVGLIPNKVSADELRAMELARAHGIHLERVPVVAGMTPPEQETPAPEPQATPSPITSPSQTDAVQPGPAAAAGRAPADLARLARSELEVLADAGDAGAQLVLAQRAKAAKQEGEARMWLSKAAKSGNADAQFALAESYRLGEKPDEVESISWYRAAARQGHAGALKALEAMYREAGLTMPPLGTGPSASQP
ncbi:MAG: hypothetical protein RL434_266 [Pseudomonadota bacterium]